MSLKMRRYAGEEDYWRIRAFLRETWQAWGGQPFTWPVARLDYWRWFVSTLLPQPPLEECLFLWETADGQLAAVLTPEERAEGCPQVHPAFQSPALEHEIFEVAEEHYPLTVDGERRMVAMVRSDDRVRQAVLAERGYARSDWPESQWSQTLTAPPAVRPPPPGYVVRALGESSELPQRAWVSWRAFHPDEPDAAYEGWEWYHLIQRMPLYRRDLDIVAVSDSGEFAAFCTLWYDDVSRSGLFEPVGVEPAHHRKGLGTAVMTEAMARFYRMGGIHVSVGGFTEAANGLYGSLMGNCTIAERWRKVW